MKNKLISGPLAILMLLLANGPFLSAQDDTLPAVSTGAGVDLVSRYIWRGQDYGHAPSIQPGLSASWRNFTVGAWGAYKVTGPGCQETDFYLSKEIGFITLALWDYWSFTDESAMDFFDYRAASTAHQLEAQLLLTGSEKLPFKFLASYFFYGADTTRSIYLELQYFRQTHLADWSVFAGYQPKGTFYAPGASFVNIGCSVKKELPLNERFALPLSLSLVFNPAAGSAWLVAGLSLYL